MLNEIDEFKLYTAPLDGMTHFENHRLKYFTLIKKNFAGLERAMTVIARKLIFGDSDKPNLDVSDVKKCLRAWCGFKKDTHPLVQRGWLPAFLNQQFLPYDKDNILQVALKNLRDKEEHFNRSLFDLQNNGKNNFRAINFDRVIANALLLGKLKCFYLLYTGDSLPFKHVLFNERALNKARREMALKLTAFYLLQQRLSHQIWVTFNKLNFLNWLSSDSKPESWHLELFYYFQPLFETVNVRKVVKLRVDPKWVANFRLIEEPELYASENVGRIFFSDSGAAAPLVQGLCSK